MSPLTENDVSVAPNSAIVRRRWPWAVALGTVGLLVTLVLFWFQPQKLFVDERVVEPIPSTARQPGSTPTSRPSPAVRATDAASVDPSPSSIPGSPADTAPKAEPTAAAVAAAAASAPTELTSGELVSRDHATTGTARVLEFVNGHRFVRFEGLDTSNGPDLYVYLTANPAAGDEAAFDDEFVSLGRLKGNQGDQNYDIPDGTDLGRFTTVVIWCDRFDSAFGAADLRPA